MPILVFLRKSILFFPRRIFRLLKPLFKLLLFFIFTLLFFLVALLSRFKRKYNVGFGPEPLINNVHHKKALLSNGIEAETFVTHCYYISNEFDIIIKGEFSYLFFIKLLLRYKAVFYYFNGGLLSFSYPRITLLCSLEPFFLKLANIKTILMPYGSDIQDFNVYNDVVYKNAYNSDYPQFLRKQFIKTEKRVKFWLKYADWVIAGCDWVNYLPYWDTLMLAHFSVDNKKWFPLEHNLPPKFNKERPLRILHAPNHKAIKGTNFIEKNINELITEGYPIEYSLIQKVPNDQLVPIVQNADIVIDQLVIGWYGIFSLEVMSCKKPVLVYIKPELERLYILSGLLDINELPFIKSDYDTLKDNIINILNNPSLVSDYGEKSFNYVNKHHSCEYVGKVFSDILIKLGCHN